MGSYSLRMVSSTLVPILSVWFLRGHESGLERGESGFALPLGIDSSRDITVANLHLYRVISSFQPFPWAVKVSNSRDIRFRNVHCYSNSKVSYDAAVFDQDRGVEVRQREFAWLDVFGRAPQARRAAASPTLARGAKVEKLAGGFYNISGGAAGPQGDFYFVDAHWQRIHRWAHASRQLSTFCDFPLDPVNLAVDKAGDLVVVSYTPTSDAVIVHRTTEVKISEKPVKETTSNIPKVTYEDIGGLATAFGGAVQFSEPTLK